MPSTVYDSESTRHKRHGPCHEGIYRIIGKTLGNHVKEEKTDGEKFHLVSALCWAYLHLNLTTLLQDMLFIHSPIHLNDTGVHKVKIGRASCRERV